jgi:membrane-bound serine protease (ClpP class)
MIEAILIIILLIVLALVLVAMEILTPSFGLLTLGALGAMAAAVWVAASMINTFIAILLIIAFIIGVPMYVYAMLNYLPKTRWGGKIFLAPSGDAEAWEGSGVPESRDFEKYVGKDGVAETALRPSGAVRIDGKRIVAVAEGGLIESGSRIHVVRAEDMSLVVRKVRDEASAAQQ